MAALRPRHRARGPCRRRADLERPLTARRSPATDAARSADVDGGRSGPPARILFFGTYDEEAHPRVRVLREGLEDRGHLIRVCNAPLGVDTAARVDAVRSPRRAVGLVGRLVRAWRDLVRLGRRFRGPHRPDVVIVGYLGELDVHLARRLFDAPIVLDLMAPVADTVVDRGLDRPWLGRILAEVDRAAVRAADLVVVDTDEHAAGVEERSTTPTAVVAVGAPRAWFADNARTEQPTAEPSAPAPLRVVFFGLYTPLQGAPVIGEAIGLLASDPRIRFTMIGDGQQRTLVEQASAANPRVRWMPWTAPAELPALVSAHDVCLGIFGTGPKAMRVVPNKLYQGAAAGCALVTSQTAPQCRVLGEGAMFVPPGDAQALADGLVALVEQPAVLAQLRLTARELAEQRFAPREVVAPIERWLRNRP